MNEAPPVLSPSSSPSITPSSSPFSPSSPSSPPAANVPGAFLLGVALAVVGKVLPMVAAASVMGSPDTLGTMRLAAYVSTLQPIGLVIGAFGLTKLAFDHRTDRVVTAAAILGAAVLAANAV